ncbi:AAA family ATPase [Streptomyces sp. NPDC098101]|uniref:helix-turn-helix transcriptional regulator n=2 Tax=unclassified Streptomyces TaxID=2593676 RepID=UPI0038074C8D
MTSRTIMRSRVPAAPGGRDGPGPEDVLRLLRTERRVVVRGPWGTGKSTLLAAVNERLRAGAPAGAVFLSAAREDDRASPYAVLRKLLAFGCPPGHLRALPAAYADRLLALATSSPAQAVPEPDHGLLRIAVTALFAAHPGAVLVVDGAQWTDERSADVLAYAVHALAGPVGTGGPPLSVLAAERAAARPGDTPAAERLLGSYAAVLPLRPLDTAWTADRLTGAGLPSRWAPAVHRHCGGHPLLTREACAALAGTPAGSGRLELAGAARDAARTWLRTLPRDVRTTLTAAALARHPTTGLLVRAGHPDAEARVAVAERAGLVGTDASGTVRFACGALREAAADDAGARGGRRVHRSLAAATRDPVHRVRHLALAQETPDGGLARRVERAAGKARAAAEPALAAELLVLSARLTPVDARDDGLRRLARAARDAAASSSVGVAAEVRAELDRMRAPRRDRLAAALALVDAHGQALVEAEPLLGAAQALAGRDPGLLAQVELRRAIQTNVCRGEPERALRAATRSSELARRAGDTTLEAAALTMRARMERITGRPSPARHTLDRALGLHASAAAMGIRNSPEYLAARHAVFDDRLTDARDRLLTLLPQAEAVGNVEDLVDVLRSLAEAEARSGHCAEALERSARAVGLTARHGLSPGPAWYTAALAQQAGGSFGEAVRLAGLAVRASREEHDVIHLSRSLWVRAACRLAMGEAAVAATALAEVEAVERDQRVADPTMLRWQPDAVESLAASPGTLDRAEELLERTRSGLAAGGFSVGTFTAGLYRAEAACLLRRGDAGAAEARLRTAHALFEDAGLPLEAGRTLLAWGRLERSRRRQAAARTAWRRAEEVFTACAAEPWREQAADLLGRLAGRAAPARTETAGAEAPESLLTASEHRLAVLVCRGATNQEAAQHLFVSVKTVEASLSRVYRKLGVRSRGALAASFAPRLVPGDAGEHEDGAGGPPCPPAPRAWTPPDERRHRQ